MNPITDVGNLHLDERRLDKIQAAHKPEIIGRIREIVARQVALHGAEKPFRFKALGFQWRYEPEAKH